MLSPFALITVSKVQEVLNLDEDTNLEFLINSASLKANSISKRILAQTTHNKILDGTGWDTLILPEYPVTSVTGIFDDPTRDWGDESLLSLDDLILDNGNGVLFYKNGTFSKGEKTIKVEYTAGYPIDEAPGDLLGAIIESIAFNINRFSGGGNKIGLKTLSADGVISSSYEINLPLTIRSVFESYKREPNI